MSDQAVRKLNSGAFPNIVECVEHWHTNTVAIGNVSKHILFKGGFVMDEPHHVLYEYRQLLLQDVTEKELRDEFRFRPKAVAEDVYGTPDLWYVVLMANGMTHPRQLLGPMVKYVRPGKLGQILSIINKRKPEIDATRANPTPVENRTLVNIDLEG